MFKTHKLINVPILECLAGMYGYNCAMKCPMGYYGILCVGGCNCSRNVTCHPLESCINEPEYFMSKYGKKNSAFAFLKIRYPLKGTLKIDTKCLFILDKCKAGKE